MPSPRRDRVQQMVDAVDNYEATVTALLAFINNATWDEASRSASSQAKYSLGRRMTTSRSNRVTPAVDVTPDAIVQRSEQEGVVCEAKMNLAVKPDRSVDPARLDEIWQQVRKYDDDLTGWYTLTGRIGSHDIVVLCDLTREAYVTDYLKLQLAKEPNTRKIAVVAITRSTQAVEYVVLKKQYGDISDATWCDRLRHGINVPMEALVASKLAQIKFTDSPPDTPLYTIHLLWSHVFPSMAAKMNWETTRSTRTIRTCISEATKFLRDFYGVGSAEDKRNPELPPEDWVRDALEMLTNIGMARRTGDGEYDVLFRRLNGDTVRAIAKKIAQWENSPSGRRSTSGPHHSSLFD